MRIKERYELAAELASRYWAGGRRERGEILDGFCLATGYNRKYAKDPSKTLPAWADVAPFA